VIPPEHAKAAPAGAKVEVMPGAGHMAMMEKASDFNALLKGHLAEQ
jgi:pyruvate dehydrogenase E2 component (dihydrolipoamide acetyltransferase)